MVSEYDTLALSYPLSRGILRRIKSGDTMLTPDPSFMSVNSTSGGAPVSGKISDNSLCGEEFRIPERLREPGRFLYPAGTDQEGHQRFKMDGVGLIVLDIDGTVAIPSAPGLGEVLRERVHSALMAELRVSHQDAVRIADHYRGTKRGGEFAFLDPRLKFKLIELSVRSFCGTAAERPCIDRLWDAFAEVDPAPYFAPAPKFVAQIQSWRSAVKVVALTDSPAPFSRRTLEALGFNPDTDFDFFRAWERGDVGPPKRALQEEAFKFILERFDMPAERAVSIGDSPDFDILPAIAAGMKAVLISAHARPSIQGIGQLVV